MNLKKLKFKLQVLINPRLWLRLERTNKSFDKLLWDWMEEGYEINPYYHGGYKGLPPAKHAVEFAGKQIWVSNAPYCDGSLYFGEWNSMIYSSRATALRFRRMYKEYMKNKVEKELAV